uniref:Uncharacterized protein n=1 Tax=Myotis myotis TaxID=51298 RepID=A0A7J7VIM4_MYOMY|nr:hypothetical protein mMyoMyo1_008399 [Myotis myotis]
MGYPLHFLQTGSSLSLSPVLPPFKSVNRGTQTQGQWDVLTHVCSHPHTLPLTWVLRCPACSFTRGLSQAPFSFMLAHSSQVHTSSTKPHSRLIITHSYTLPLPPTRTGTDPRGNTFRSFTPDTLPPPVPASPLQGTPTGAAPPPCTSPHTPPASTLTRLPQSPPPPGRPAPPNPCTPTGSCLKLQRSPPPPPAGDLYQVIRK